MCIAKPMVLSTFYYPWIITQSEKNDLEESAEQKDRLLQLKESELLRNIQLKDTEVKMQDVQLAETRQELNLVQVHCHKWEYITAIRKSMKGHLKLLEFWNSFTNHDFNKTLKSSLKHLVETRPKFMLFTGNFH